MRLIHLSVSGPQIAPGRRSTDEGIHSLLHIESYGILFYTFVQFRLALCVSWLQHSQGFILDKFLDNFLTIVCKPLQEILMF